MAPKNAKFLSKNNFFLQSEAGHVLKMSLIFGKIPAWCPYKLCSYIKKKCKGQRAKDKGQSTLDKRQRTKESNIGEPKKIAKKEPQNDRNTDITGYD